MAAGQGGGGAWLDQLARTAAGDGVSRRAVVRQGAALLAGVTLASPLAHGVGGAEAAEAAVRRRKSCKPGHVRCAKGCCAPGQTCVTPKRKRSRGPRPKPRCECVAPRKQCGSSCLDVSSDPHNCGACGHSCASGQVCSHGQCATTCAAGQAACSGACVTLASDPANCGSCGRACPAGQVCSGGQCTIVCPAGQTNCAGACVRLASDVGNCGACGSVCAPANATGVCTGGTCGIQSCHAGYGNCDGNVTNGCETNINTDPSNCGACGTACPTHSNGQATCSAGVCGTTCNNGYTYCGGPAPCVNTTNDPNNCGACGTKCATGHSCASGACV